MELQPVGLLPSINLVHLLVHARWWDHSVALGWDRSRRDAKHLHPPSIKSDFRSNGADSQNSWVSCALSPTCPTHVMSRPCYLSCMLYKYSYKLRSFGTLSHPSKSCSQAIYLRNQRCNQCRISTATASGLIHYCVCRTDAENATSRLCGLRYKYF